MTTELLDSYYQHCVVENGGVDDHKLLYRKLNRHRSSIPLCIHAGLWSAVAAKHMETLRWQASHCVVKPLNMQQQHSPLLFHFVSNHQWDLFWLVTQKFMLSNPSNGDIYLSGMGFAWIGLLLSVCFMSYNCTVFRVHHCFPKLFINLLGCELIYRSLILFGGEAERDQCFSVPCMHVDTRTCTQCDGKLMSDHQIRQCRGIVFMKLVQSKISLCWILRLYIYIYIYIYVDRCSHKQDLEMGGVCIMHGENRHVRIRSLDLCTWKKGAIRKT
jgi:hypothetical protein